MTPATRLGRVPRSFAAALLLTLAAAVGSCARGGPGAGDFSMPPMPVETAVVSRERVLDRYEAVGSIEASEAVIIVSEIDARVVSLPFREGQPVRRGAPLVLLDGSQLAAEVDRTAALRDQAEATYTRVKTVVDQGAGSAQDLDDVAAALKVAEANLALARTRLAKARISAPFSGVVGSKRVSPGAYVRAGTMITDLAQIFELKVVFSAPERYLSKLKRGAPVVVSTTAYSGYELKGRIDVIDPVLDPATRSAQVIARVMNPGGRFRPGMSANVSAVLSERMNALTIPTEAVFAEGNQTYVYVVLPDTSVSKTAVTLGTRLSDVVEVVQGLEAGARVVRAGHQKLFDKARVALPPPAEAQATGAGSGGAGGPGAAAKPAGKAGEAGK